MRVSTGRPPPGVEEKSSAALWKQNSAIKTPGSTGSPGKWPANAGRSARTSHSVRMRVGDCSTMRSTNRKGGRCGSPARTSLEATGHLQHGAVHVARLHVAEHAHREGDLRGRTEPRRGDAGEVMLAQLLGQVGQQLRVDEARRDAVDRDLLAP